jgi:hypothetical protein
LSFNRQIALGVLDRSEHKIAAYDHLPGKFGTATESCANWPQ